MKAIQTNNLVKKYGKKTAVNNLNFSVGKGELFALLGVNGAGKTTTIKMLSCLARPTSGEAWILGESILTSPYSVKSMINVSPQETAIAPYLTVKENLEMIAGIYGFDKKTSKMKTVEMLGAFELADVSNHKSKTLSGGNQRRLSIAMALISDPQVLFLDEPTLGLDVLARRKLWSRIESLKGKITIIMTTHYMEEADALSDRIGIMSQGNLKAVGTAIQLTAQTGAANFENAFIALATESG